MKSLTTLTIGLLLAPILTFAHSGYHPTPHPIDSPNYHPIDTEPVSITTSISPNQETLIQLLMQLMNIGISGRLSNPPSISLIV